MIIKDLIFDGMDFLGSYEGARLDCELLLSFAMGQSREYLVINFTEEVFDGEMRMFYHYLERLKAGEPVAYIIQKKEFFGLDFFVDKRVLIPRPETEQLVEEVLVFLNEGGREKVRILDVGTGSGAIALAVASSLKEKGWDGVSEIFGVDVSACAVEVAEVNARQFLLDDEVKFFVSDLLEVVDEGESFSVIAANLPYIGEKKNRFVSGSAERYEPHLALFGGEDGLFVYRRLFEEIERKGVGFEMLIGEFGFAQAEDVAVMLEERVSGRWRILKDLAGIDRFFVVRGEG